jgi:hypothetical protein
MPIASRRFHYGWVIVGASATVFFALGLIVFPFGIS